MSRRIYALLGAILIILLTRTGLNALVPPHPMYRNVPEAFRVSKPELPKGAFSAKDREIPNNILVLRVQFLDLSFVSVPSFPDSLVHNSAFFDRWMLHLADFYNDASHGRYALNYTLWDQVFTMSHPLAYYGADTPEMIDVRVEAMVAELIAMADPAIDFRQYGGIIVFHAGPGQEADISSIRTDNLWSTFVTRKNLQDALDPDNDDYPGITTADGIDLKNIVLVGESEFHDYFPLPPDPNSSTYLFSIYGVLAHQFGHLIGLPTLFDNDSSNGQSQGIGNWGLMGTGVWNASGYVPAQLCAWSRYHLGWEDAVTISMDIEGVQVDYFQNQNTLTPRLYKIPISESEYFLIENRQQNPDDSVDPYSGQPSYSFNLLPEGEQDYYANYPLLPYFNFMENRYKGSEWDFMLPGLGGPLMPGQNVPIDGSGLLIWHIDENVIAANFDPGFERNRVNADASHKGVDLEEADGIENLDTAIFDYYKYGGPYDSFRPGNNDYFGYATHNGLLSLPNAMSYYGGIGLEIYNIVQVGKKLSFSVRFDWKLEANYTGVNGINGAMLDLDKDGEDEIFYPMPDGQLYLWKNEVIAPGYPIETDSLALAYTWDGNDLWLPLKRDNLSRLRKLNNDGISTVFNKNGYSWASPPIDTGNELICGFNPIAAGGGELFRLNKENEDLAGMANLPNPLVANLSLFRDKIYAIDRAPGSDYSISIIDLQTESLTRMTLPIPADSLITGMFIAPLDPSRNEGQIIIQTSKALYAFNQNISLVDGFPFVHDSNVTAGLTISDPDKNGSLDIILGTDSGVITIDYSGHRMGFASLSSPGASSSGGVLVLDIDHDGVNDLVGCLGNNRLSAWTNRYQLKEGFPVSFGDPLRHLPLIGKASDDSYYLWVTGDNGRIYRKELPEFSPADKDSLWFTEYANLRRTASRERYTLPNQYQTSKVFVPGEVYIYPNPVKTYHDKTVHLNIMTSVDTDLTLKVYDISGSLVYKKTGQAKAYLRNRDLFSIRADKLSSGVYIVILSNGKESLNMKFAIEK